MKKIGKNGLGDMMTDKILKKLISLIKHPDDYTVLWNNGNDHYLRLDNIVYEWEDGTFAFFKDFKQREHIDLDNCSIDDFLYFKKIDLMEEIS